MYSKDRKQIYCQQGCSICDCSDNGEVPLYVTLRDLGKDIYFGIPSQTNLLRGRLVELPGSVANSGEGGTVGFVWIEVNASELNTGESPILVGVART